MRIGVLGTGNMAQALGTQWAGAGHQLLFAGRSAVRARALADRTGSTSGTFEEAVSFGSVLLLALPYDAALDTVTALAAATGRCATGC